ncbi:MAG: ABC transporter permease [Bacteroidetes bacterium]|nr:ABC transporter permease [Bacteroidota bacterium]
MRAFKKILKTALRSILRNRMRSMLTALGIIIGVSAVIIMVAIGRGSAQKIQNDINSLGTNLITVSPGAARSGGVSQGSGSINRFTFRDVEKIKKEAVFIKGVSPVVRVAVQVIGDGKNWSTSIYGVSTDYFNIRKWEVENGGELFTERDVIANKKVALIGKTVADNLFPSGSAVGKQIRIRNSPFKVIGVLKSKGQGGMMDQDDIILAPSTTVFYRLKGGEFIDMINVSAISEDKVDNAQKEIEVLMRESHRLGQTEENDFSIRTQAEMLETISSVTAVVTLLLASIAGVSLLVGGIGIMNIMLVSVTERTREIGIRMSVGARGSDILIQFLTEAAVLSISAGIIGILLSVSVIVFINSLTTLSASMSVDIVLIAFLFSGAIGIFFGFYPARKAAAMNPIDALRYE